MSGPGSVSHDNPDHGLPSDPNYDTENISSSDSSSDKEEEREEKQHEDSEEQFVISAAAELAGMHAQTLRAYDRLGLVRPLRTKGGGRRYTRRDIKDLLEIQRLSQEGGINLAGIKKILELTRRIEFLEAQLHDLSAQKTVSLRVEKVIMQPLSPGTDLEIWKPRKRKKFH